MKYYNDQAFFDEKDQGQSSRWQLQFKVKASAPTVFTLCLRVPAWVNGAPVVSVNGEAAHQSCDRKWLPENPENMERRHH